VCPQVARVACVLMFNILAKHIAQSSALATLFLNVVWSFVAASDFVLGLLLVLGFLLVFGLLLFDLIFSVLNLDFSDFSDFSDLSDLNIYYINTIIYLLNLRDLSNHLNYDTKDNKVYGYYFRNYCL
jgi:hypothetical protein